MGQLVGVIADTHGLLRPAALRLLTGCDLILHAGDVGTPEVLSALQAIAPVTAVRGNVDRGPWAEALPERAVVTVLGQRLYVLHDVTQLDLDPAVAGYRAVISGHSHRASIRWHNGTLYLNPGGAGPRRFRLPLTLALLRANVSGLEPEIEQIEG